LQKFLKEVGCNLGNTRLAGEAGSTSFIGNLIKVEYMKAVFFVSKTVSKLLFDPPDERRELPLFSNVLLHAPPTRRVSRRIRTYCSTKRVSRERVENYLNFDPSTLLRVSFLLLTFNFLLLTYF